MAGNRHIPAMTLAKISIITPCYTEERLKDITELLDSVQAQTYNNIETLIVAERSPELASSIRSYVIVAVIEERSYGYKKIIRDVAKSYGLYPYEIEQLFKKCREAYDKAVKEANETKKKLG